MEDDTETLAQLRWIHRFREVTGIPDGLRLLRVAAPALRRQKNEPGYRQHRIGLDGAPQFQAVHVWQLHVNDRHVARMPLCRRLAHERQGPLAISRYKASGFPTLEIDFQDAPIDGTVIHNADLQPMKTLERHDAPRGGFLLLLAERNIEPESAALTEPALHTDVATHKLRQLFADRKPQSRPAEFPCRRAIGLHERLKQAILRVRGQTDAGIMHFKPHCGLSLSLVRQGDGNDDFALLRKLDGVPHKVNQDLADSSWVAVQGGRHICVKEAG